MTYSDRFITSKQNTAVVSILIWHCIFKKKFMQYIFNVIRIEIFNTLYLHQYIHQFRPRIKIWGSVTFLFYVILTNFFSFRRRNQFAKPTDHSCGYFYNIIYQIYAMGYLLSFSLFRLIYHVSYGFLMFISLKITIKYKNFGWFIQFVFCFSDAYVIFYYRFGLLNGNSLLSITFLLDFAAIFSLPSEL